MLKTIGVLVVAIVALLAVLFIYAATRPDTFRVQRVASIKASPEKIFALINDFRSWDAWSPWEQKDPAMRRSMSGAANGEGAVYEWDGDKNVGKGRMEITESSPPSRIRINLDLSGRSRLATLSSSRFGLRATPRTSPGPCRVPCPTSRS